AIAMAEAGVDISDQRSKHIDELRDIDFDYVITLCDNARQQCPVFSGKAKVIHRAFDDPYFASGSEEEVMAVFRRVRDEIKSFVEGMPDVLTSKEASK
ncbi:MAG TPA: arsenate reductase ArsC, partial [Phycisphaerales bacterium]|nr:arsenate reductase ArsC [Phycisphaerales bacterium]